MSDNKQLQELRTEFDRMILANRVKIGTYTNKEISTLQLQLLRAEQATLDASIIGLAEKINQARAVRNRAQEAYEKAQATFFAATTALDSLGFRDLDYSLGAERITKEVKEITEQLEAEARGVKLSQRF